MSYFDGNPTFLTQLVALAFSIFQISLHTLRVYHENEFTVEEKLLLFAHLRSFTIELYWNRENIELLSTDLTTWLTILWVHRNDCRLCANVQKNESFCSIERKPPNDTIRANNRKPFLGTAERWSYFFVRSLFNRC